MKISPILLLLAAVAAEPAFAQFVEPAPLGFEAAPLAAPGLSLAPEETARFDAASEAAPLLGDAPLAAEAKYVESLPALNGAPAPAVLPRKSKLLQLLRLPLTMWEIHKIVEEEYSPVALDENVWAHHGFHVESWDPHYKQRRWIPVPIRDIQPSQVKGISVKEMSEIMRVAMEIEDPIMDYTVQSGEGFRFLLPSLGRFMGKNDEQMRYAKEHDVPWCESAWCSEEKRHGPALGKMVRGITGAEPVHDNPNDVDHVTSSEKDAIHHVISRETTEWNASSGYVVVAAHASGPLQGSMKNVMRDEIKHLSVVSGADKYLFGPRPWGRFKDMLKQSWYFLVSQKRDRTTGGTIGSNPVTMLEVALTHFMTEYYVRRWLATVPYSTLQANYEPSSNLPELEAFKPTPERQAELDKLLSEGLAKRQKLERWSPRARSDQRWKLTYEAGLGRMLDSIVAGPLKGFAGAEEPGSAGDREARKIIRAVGRSRTQRELLIDRLRDYQIRNNRHVRARTAVKPS